MPMDPLSEDLLAILGSEEPWPFPFTKEDWEKTPHAVRLYVALLHNKLIEHAKLLESLGKQVDELKTRLNRNSSNSNQPPSLDPPFKKKKDKAHKGKPGGKKGHKGHRQVLLEPGETKPVKPECCQCGNTDFPDTEPFYTHQL